MNLMILAGAGTSVELGVPAMAGMAREFVDHASQWNIEPESVKQLMGDTTDIEYLINELDKLCSASPTLKSIGLNTDEIQPISKIRSEVEWFVQHAAERVVPKEAELMWGGVLKNCGNHEISLITTNYDRAIELAANAVNVDVNDGFDKFGEGELAQWNEFLSEGNEVMLAKLHGSTDWYEDVDSKSSIKLRHPMPLFGGTKLGMPSGQELGSALVLPSREKLLTHSPYPRLSQAFLNSADKCEAAIFVGTSLRDNHLRDAAISTARKKVPVFFVSPGEMNEAFEDAIHVKQFASTFLTSTLPNAMSSTDLVAYIHEKSESEKSDVGVFQKLMLALDVNADTTSRCDALEYIEDMEIAPNAWILERLLDDKDLQVARYALGLITHSPHSYELCKRAKISTHKHNAPFMQDLALLEQMMST